MFTEKVNIALGDSFKHEDFVNDPELEDLLGTPVYQPYHNDNEEPMPSAPDADERPDADTYDDQYVGAEVVFPIRDQMMNAKVRGWKRQLDRTCLCLVGTLHCKANKEPNHCSCE